MKRLIRQFKIKAIRYYLRLRSKKLSTNETQKLGYQIVLELLHNPKSKLLLAPQYGARYIQLDDVFIKLYDTSASIINGKYSYYISLDMELYTKLTTVFDNRNESARKKIETLLTNKTNKSLRNILQEVKNEQLSIQGAL